MPLIEAQAVRAVLLIALIAIIFTGVAFAGVAAFLALAPYMPVAAAAAVVAFVLLAVVFLAALVMRGRVRLPHSKPANASPDEAAVALIASMAKEKPLLAVLFAGLLGAAGTILQQKNRVN